MFNLILAYGHTLCVYEDNFLENEKKRGRERECGGVGSFFIFLFYFFNIGRIFNITCR